MEVNGRVEGRVVLIIYLDTITLIDLKFRSWELIIDHEHLPSVPIWCTRHPGRRQIEDTAARRSRRPRRS